MDKQLIENCLKETQDHIYQVQTLMEMMINGLANRASVHDKSKLEYPELEIFAEYTPKLKSSTYGSDEYKTYLQEMKVALDHHYKYNSHHPEWEDFNKVDWRDIQGYEGIYQISNYGDVKSLSRTVERKKQGSFMVKEQILKATVTTKGYLRIQLSKNGENSNHFIHRLVATHFLGNPENLPQVNHKDTNKLNNYYKNLEWCNNSDNQLHAYRNGLRQIKYIVHCPELNLITFGCGEMERKLKELGYEKARESTILACINGTSSHHLGLHFEDYQLREHKRSKLSNMNLLDLVEMFCDWKAAAMRHEDGDIHRSIEINKKRFDMSDDLVEIFKNTAKMIE